MQSQSFSRKNWGRLKSQLPGAKGGVQTPRGFRPLLRGSVRKLHGWSLSCSGHAQQKWSCPLFVKNVWGQDTGKCGCWHQVSGTVVKNPPANAGNAGDAGWIPGLGRSLDWKDPLEEEMATRSSILAWSIPWTEEPGGLQSMGSQRVGQDWVTKI